MPAIALLPLADGLRDDARRHRVAGRVRFFRVAEQRLRPFHARRPTPRARVDAAPLLAHARLQPVLRLASRLVPPSAWVYKDLYAIYAGSALADEHPEWILRDAARQRALHPVRLRAAARARSTPPTSATRTSAPAGSPTRARCSRQGYRGLFVDDVNMTLARVANGNGQPVAPIDPRTGAADDGGATGATRWRPSSSRSGRPSRPPRSSTTRSGSSATTTRAVQRQLLSADLVSLERGVNDAGLRGGSGPFGFESFLGARRLAARAAADG